MFELIYRLWREERQHIIKFDTLKDANMARREIKHLCSHCRVVRVRVYEQQELSFGI